MAKLKNPKHEKVAQLIGRKGLTKKEAYAQVYPDASPATLEVNPSALTRSPKVQDRIKAILSRHKVLELENVVESLKNQVEAKKVLFNKGEEVQVDDHSVQLEAKKYVINDLYGVKAKTEVNIDNRSLNINMDTSIIEPIKELVASLNDLRKSLPDKDLDAEPA